MINKISHKKKTLLVVGLVSSCVFGYLSFRNFEWGILRQAMITINLRLCLFAGLALVLSFSLRAYRWKYFLPPNSNFTFSSRLSGVAIGYFFHNILPVRLGDLIRPGYLAKANQQPYQVCLYSVVIERVWELVLFLIIALALFKYSGIVSDGMLPINFPLLIVLIMSGVLFLVFTRSILKLLLNILVKLKIMFIAKPVRDVLEAFEGGFELNHTIILVLSTISIVFMEGMFFVYIIDSLNIRITFLGKFIVMIIATLSWLLPSAPASIGVFHYFCQLGLIMLGINSDVALSAAIVIHAYMFIFDLIFALFCIFFGPLRSRCFFRKSY